MKNQKGLGLIGVFLIIGVLAITAGGMLVWEKNASVPIHTPSQIETAVSSLSALSPSDVVAKKDTLIGKKVSVKGYAREAIGPCTGEMTNDCNHCRGSIVLSTTQREKMESLDNIRGAYYYVEGYDNAIWLIQNDAPFRCTGSGEKPNCTYECPGWKLGAFYQVGGVWRHDQQQLGYFLEVISKQKL